MANYIWPISKSEETSDEMNTSFGPRIDRDRWDFHDGIDLPACIGRAVYAMRKGTVVHADPAQGKTERHFGSRHVVIKVDDPSGETIYLGYIHLDRIAEGIVKGADVDQGDLIGTVGEDDAHYPHLHIEFRKEKTPDQMPDQSNSVHPLGCLPYTHTPLNFQFPDSDLPRFNRFGRDLAARIPFESDSKLQGDLKRVEVDLMTGDELLETRVVDFKDKDTVNEGNSDGKTFKKNIGVEGYQKSDMVAHCRDDLQYGILLREIPENCDTLIARIIDVQDNPPVVSPPIAVPQDQEAVNQRIDFEDGQMPPPDWDPVTSPTGSGTTVTNDTAAGTTGSPTRLMRSTDASTTETTSQRAGIEYTLPPGRFEWTAEAWFNPMELNLASGQSVYLLHFRHGAKLSVAAYIHLRFIDNFCSELQAGIIIKKPDGTLKAEDSSAIIRIGEWRKWRLHLLRIGTRETTAVLYLNEDGELKEQARINWDSTTNEPLSFRVGIGRSFPGDTATVLTDEVRVTESRLPL
jgi:hypothetical protein